MIVIPAIDLLDGKVVRLIQGQEQSATVYSDDPLEFAIQYQEAGARWIHVVNLDGAFGRPGMNDAVIERISRNVDIPIELGGGIRTLDRIEFWLERGIGRVVLGSVAVQSPEIIQQAIDKHGEDSIVAGIDIQEGKVAISGWTEKTQIQFIELAKNMKNLGICRVIVTDIIADGMLTGPNIDTMIDIAGNTGLSVIVSGGVGSMQDIRKVADAAGLGIEGVIIGKAIYENKIDVAQAIQQFQT
ncbi:1-(5-phosphoribosyl)-5-[(5-phosphoribosylamino)methylideneamino]imidazole-4-carboxamide isomerase [bacterium]|nr:1-(5-phosphoribosyl)-5-[(5-phosphoribosylamino)methylideneamino]imidazole-4-carboxamide isomerase [bacterium]